jgi:hypothetical protein
MSVLLIQQGNVPLVIDLGISPSTVVTRLNENVKMHRRGHPLIELLWSQPSARRQCIPI